jgi:hypothetical protein
MRPSPKPTSTSERGRAPMKVSVQGLLEEPPVPPARAENRRKGQLSALRAHTNPP